MFLLNSVIDSDGNTLALVGNESKDKSFSAFISGAWETLKKEEDDLTESIFQCKVFFGLNYGLCVTVY